MPVAVSRTMNCSSSGIGGGAQQGAQSVGEAAASHYWCAVEMGAARRRDGVGGLGSFTNQGWAVRRPGVATLTWAASSAFGTAVPEEDAFQFHLPEQCAYALHGRARAE